MLVGFKTGLKTNLPTTGVAGTFYITTDTGEMFLFITPENRIQINADWVLKQITETLNKKIYIQDSEPTSAPIGALWIDTSIESVVAAEGAEF